MRGAGFRNRKLMKRAGRASVGVEGDAAVSEDNPKLQFTGKRTLRHGEAAPAQRLPGRVRPANFCNPAPESQRVPCATSTSTASASSGSDIVWSAKAPQNRGALSHERPRLHQTPKPWRVFHIRERRQTKGHRDR